jgi:hypothetical protein
VGAVAAGRRRRKPRCGFTALRNDAALVCSYLRQHRRRASHSKKTVAAVERSNNAGIMLFGTPLGDAAIVATVSHQHIYGLLFKVLWPLSTGRAIHARSIAFPKSWRR